MNMFFRLLRVLLAAYFTKTRTGLMDVHTLKSAVWLGDQDPSGHMTNSRYSSFTDLGIMNFMGRTGTLQAFRKKGWMPVFQHEALTYHKMMRFPQKFELQTRMVGWTGCYICFEHHFICKGRLVAESRVIARLTGRKKTRVTADMALEVMGQPMESPPLDERFLQVIDDLEARRSQDRQQREAA